MNEAPDLRNWNVVPIQLSKSVGQARFVPLLEMTRDDWKLFDWESISNNGKNDIVAMALKEPIVGFVHYIFVTKGTKNGGYYGPVPASKAGDLDTLLGAPQFKHFGRTEEALSESARRFDAAITKVTNAATFAPLAALAKHITKAVKEPNDLTPEQQKALQDIVAAEFGDLGELDALLIVAFSILHSHSIEWLEEWADEAEQILGDAEDKGQF
jgi:hypothetical protein